MRKKVIQLSVQICAAIIFLTYLGRFHLKWNYSLLIIQSWPIMKKTITISFCCLVVEELIGSNIKSNQVCLQLSNNFFYARVPKLVFLNFERHRLIFQTSLKATLSAEPPRLGKMINGQRLSTIFLAKVIYLLAALTYKETDLLLSQWEGCWLNLWLNEYLRFFHLWSDKNVSDWWRRCYQLGMDKPQKLDNCIFWTGVQVVVVH